MTTHRRIMKMSDEAIKEKKKLTKKSKILIIVLIIVAFLLIATVLGGVTRNIREISFI